MIKTVKGNILDATEDIIAHQVNCRGVMGAGLARQIRNKFPNAYDSFLEMNAIPSYKRLGKCQVIDCGEKFIANLFAQLDYGRSKTRYTDYDELRKSLIELYNFAKFNQLSIALPHGIGCGLAGGHWGIVHEIIENVFEDYEVTLYDFNK